MWLPYGPPNTVPQKYPATLTAEQPQAFPRGAYSEKAAEWEMG